MHKGTLWYKKNFILIPYSRQEIELLKRDLENAGRENTARATEVQQLRIELQRYISEVGDRQG